MKYTILITILAFLFLGCASAAKNTDSAAALRADIQRLSPEQAATESAKTGAQFIDVRTESEYKSGRAAGSQNHPMDDYDKWQSKLDKERPVIVICETGRRSQIVADKLKSDGFKSVFNVTGGFSAWSKAGLAIEK